MLTLNDAALFDRSVRCEGHDPSRVPTSDVSEPIDNLTNT